MCWRGDSRFIFQTLFLTFPDGCPSHCAFWVLFLAVCALASARQPSLCLSQGSFFSDMKHSLSISHPRHSSDPGSISLFAQTSRGKTDAVFILCSHYVHEVSSSELSESCSLTPPTLIGSRHPSVPPGIWQYLSVFTLASTLWNGLPLSSGAL